MPTKILLSVAIAACFLLPACTNTAPGSASNIELGGEDDERDASLPEMEDASAPDSTDPEPDASEPSPDVDLDAQAVEDTDDVQEEEDSVAEPDLVEDIAPDEPEIEDEGGLEDAVADMEEDVECGLGTFTGFINATDNQVLAQLDGYTSLDGTLILGSDVDDLSALHCLTSIEGDLNISSTRVLASLEGLGSLESIGGYLSMRGNEALENLRGLDALGSIGGNLTLGYNTGMTSLDGLSSLTTVGGTMHIASQDLVQIDGLSSLDSVGQGAWIIGNDSLESLDGLQVLSSVGEELRIEDNFKITNLDGLAALRSVGRRVDVFENASLANVSGLEGLLSLESLNVADNAVLCQGDAEALHTALAQQVRQLQANIGNNTGECQD